MGHNIIHAVYVIINSTKDKMMEHTVDLVRIFKR